MDGNMYALHLEDGSLRWQFATGGPIESSPISYGGNIIFGSYDVRSIASTPAPDCLAGQLQPRTVSFLRLMLPHR
jgi:outer membrane protein assembly factor BamB